MSAKRPINVAITCSRPFLDWDFNSSLLVHDALPDLIKRPGKRDVVIRKYKRVTVDTYDDVRQVSKDIWSGRRSFFLPKPKQEDEDSHVDIDFIVHLGMEVRDGFFGFETRARRDGYDQPGDDGVCVDSKGLAEEGLPEELFPRFDIKAAFKTVKEKYPETQIRVSDDAGLYFCEFRLYSSLAEAELHHKDKLGMTLFQHIPAKRESRDIELATGITSAYISALADDTAVEGNGALRSMLWAPWEFVPRLFGYWRSP